jgi:hypothetical protein
MSYLNCVASVIADSRSEQIINYDYSNPQYQKGGALQDIMHGLFEERQLGALSDYWAIGYGVIVMLHLLAGKDRAVSCPRFLWYVSQAIEFVVHIKQLFLGALGFCIFYGHFPFF